MKSLSLSSAVVAAIVLGAILAAGIAIAQQGQNKQQNQKRQGKPQTIRSKPLNKPHSNDNSFVNKGRKSVNPDPTAPARYQRALAAMRPAEEAGRRAEALLEAGNLAVAEQSARDMIALAAGQSPLLQDKGRRLMGQIRMRQGRYEDALQWFKADWMSGKDARLDLNIALCYARLGNYQMARRFYSDQSLLQYSSIKPEDLPGTNTPQSLEASILMARGMDKFLTASGAQEALADLDAAGRLAPRNGLIPYFAGMSLVHMNRTLEAGPYFQKAAQQGHGKMAEDAAWRLGNVAAWRKTHP